MQIVLGPGIVALCVKTQNSLMRRSFASWTLRGSRAGSGTQDTLTYGVDCQWQVPTLQTPEGGLWESNAIARYVARLADKGLFGSTLFDTVSLCRDLFIARQVLQL
jgi:hypothetical protein